MFNKYPSFENSYNMKSIQRFLEMFPELAEVIFIYEEKIHGANIRFHFVPNKPLIVGSREQVIENGGTGFYGLDEMMKTQKIVTFIEKFQKYSEAYNIEVTVYGEFFGPSIQKGINYGPEKDIRFFGIAFNGEMMATSVFDGVFMMNMGSEWKDYVVPKLGKVKGLEEALKINQAFDSKILAIENNLCEGIVIKPYYDVYRMPSGDIFYLKKKNDKFKEGSQKKERVPMNEELAELNRLFLSYVCQNRLDGIFGKFGKIDDERKIGEYVRMLILDAQKDFEKDYEDELAGREKKDLKKIFQAGAKASSMIIEALKE